ncbi:protein LZIC-like [Neocloeon triangulifer]|uniref:protein LZIC-like n=1 Tax=Neocloeon triangulifer TaxID=2078957 RepID=UPI00286F3BF2|nr:protein LZIC-like [Neocloeon triangulifer]
MASYGSEETEQLRERLQSQCDRLCQQLNELEEYKDDLSPEEYNESKKETAEQLQELSETMEKLVAGNMTLVDSFGAIQLSIKEAISRACPSSALKEPKQNKCDLRSRLSAVEKDLKNGRITQNESLLLKEEILKAIIQSGEKVTSEEEKFLGQLSAKNSSFVQVTDNLGLSEQAIKSASSNICSYKK